MIPSNVAFGCNASTSDRFSTKCMLAGVGTKGFHLEPNHPPIGDGNDDDEKKDDDDEEEDDTAAVAADDDDDDPISTSPPSTP